MFKELIVPARANKVLFFIGPIIVIAVALAPWAVIPFHKGWVLANIDAGMLYMMAITSLGVYGVIIAGWASNSKYAFLGAMRSGAQMISYELAMGLFADRGADGLGIAEPVGHRRRAGQGLVRRLRPEVPELELAAAAAVCA